MKIIFATIFLIVTFHCRNKESATHSEKASKTQDSVAIALPLNGLNLRDGPSSTAKVLVVLPAGSQMKIIEIQRDEVVVSGLHGNWTKVIATGNTGWVFGAKELLAKTNPFDMEFYTVQEFGSKLFSAPNVNSASILLPFGTKLRSLSQSFQIDGKGLWRLVEFGDQKGFISDQYLTTTSYSIAQLEKGPFVGMIYTNLPEFYRQYMPGAPIDGSNGGTEHSPYSVRFMNWNSESALTLEKQIRIVDGRTESMVVQVLDTGQRTAMQYAFGTQGSGNEIICFSKGNKKLPAARLNMLLDKTEKDKEGNTVHHGLVEQSWQFDVNSERLIPGDSSNAWCLNTNFDLN